MTSTRIWRLVALGFLLFIVLVAIGADTGRLPRALSALYDYPGGDKVGHFGVPRDVHGARLADRGARPGSWSGRAASGNERERYQ